MHPFIADIIVIGSGPAGLCIAADLAKLGCSVAVVTRDDQLRWPNTYGTWVDEIAGSTLDGCVRTAWSTTEVALDSGDVRDLGRGYCLLDNDAAIQRLLGIFGANDVTVRTGAVVSVAHDDVGSTVQLASGESCRAKLVVDATGTGEFTQRSGPDASLYQYAVGWRIRGAHPYPSDTMRLMDFSSDGIHAPSDPPSFLYAMPVEGGVFVEETTLISGEEADVDELSRRLHARLQRDGVQGPVEGTVETVRIAMNVALPVLSQRVVAFGAAGTMVHPATGYSVGRVLTSSAPVAQSIASSLADGAPPERIAANAYETLWPKDRVIAHELLQFGARFLSTLNTAQTRTFFRAFFSTPQSSWVAYLKGDLLAGDLASVMLAVFGACPASMRMRMMWTGAEWKTAVSAIRSLTRKRRSA